MRVHKIETNRLIIRCYKEEDAGILKKSIDESLDHLRPWMPWVKFEPEMLEQKIERLRIFKNQYENGVDYTLGSFDKEETEVIGSTGLHTRIGPNAREIGYWINSNHVSKGYATETVKALLKVGFEIENLERIEIRCDPKNLNSLKIPSNLGFTHETTLVANASNPEGEPRDTMIWALTREQYQKNTNTGVEVKAFDAKNKLLL